MAKAETFTRDEVEALIADRLKESNMTDDEKRVRAIVRDETEGVVRKVLGEMFSFEDDEDADEGGKGNAPKNKGEAGTADSIRSFLGIA